MLQKEIYHHTICIHWLIISWGMFLYEACNRMLSHYKTLLYNLI